MPRTMPISISHYEFEISKPYHEGRYMSAAEAQILNNFRAEGLKTQVSKELGRLKPDGESGLISEQQLEALRLAVKDLDEQFMFKLRPQSGPKAGTINVEIRNVAAERIEAEARKLGVELSIEKFEAAVAEWSADPAIIGEARRRFEEKLKIQTMPIEEIFGS